MTALNKTIRILSFIKVSAPGILMAMLLFQTACTPKQDPAAFKKMLADLPAKNISNYRFDPSSAIINRVQKAPEFLLGYLREMDNNKSYSSYTLSPEETADLEKNIRLLPATFTKTLKERLMGIYFVSNLAGSGMSDFIPGNDNLIYTILIINPETLRHNISEWITYREKTCFLSDDDRDKDIEISVDCGSRYTGLTYTVLHEAAHIMDYVHNFTPYAEEAIVRLGHAVPQTKFQRDVWTAYNKPAEGADYDLRAKLNFYGLGKGPRIHLHQAEALYKDLIRSPFVSLYGSLNWAEDFAEYFTWYYFTRSLGQPYKILLKKDGRIILSYEPMLSAAAISRKKTLTGILN